MNYLRGESFSLCKGGEKCLCRSRKIQNKRKNGTNNGCVEVTGGSGILVRKSPLSEGGLAGLGRPAGTF